MSGVLCERRFVTGTGARLIHTYLEFYSKFIDSFHCLKLSTFFFPFELGIMQKRLHNIHGVLYWSPVFQKVVISLSFLESVTVQTFLSFSTQVSFP